MNPFGNNGCQICGKEILNSSDYIVQEDRRKGLSGKWKYYQCQSCGVFSMRPMLNQTQIRNFYSFYSKDPSVDLTRGLGSRYPKLRKLFHKLSGDVDPRDFIQVSSGSRILDYGFGNASYLCSYHDMGYRISGVEIDSNKVVVCRNEGLDVVEVDDFSKIPYDDQTFDIVYLMQVIEHLRNPHIAMQELARILKDDGMLYLAFPNASSLWRRIFSKNWISGWFAPFHLYIYNYAALVCLAKEYGFEVVEKWSRTPGAWFILNLKSFLYPNENKIEQRSSWLDAIPIRIIIIVLLRLIELPFRDRDCMVVKLRKKN